MSNTLPKLVILPLVDLIIDEAKPLISIYQNTLKAEHIASDEWALGELIGKPIGEVVNTMCHRGTSNFSEENISRLNLFSVIPNNKYKRIAWEEIASVELMRINPLKEFGGWGLRYGKLGTAYTTRGRYILHIKQKTGKSINLTIAQPTKFIAAATQQQWPVALKTTVQ